MLPNVPLDFRATEWPSAVSLVGEASAVGDSVPLS